MFLYGNTEILRDYVKEPRIEDYFQRSTLNISNVTLVFIFGTIYCAFDSLHEYIMFCSSFDFLYYLNSQIKPVLWWLFHALAF